MSVNNARNTAVRQQGLPLLGKCHRGLNVCLPCLSLSFSFLPSFLSPFLLSFVRSLREEHEFAQDF